jgi:hypothetical protein
MLFVVLQFFIGVELNLVAELLMRVLHSSTLIFIT